MWRRFWYGYLYDGNSIWFYQGLETYNLMWKRVFAKLLRICGLILKSQLELVQVVHHLLLNTIKVLNHRLKRSSGNSSFIKLSWIRHPYMVVDSEPDTHPWSNLVLDGHWSTLEWQGPSRNNKSLGQLHHHPGTMNLFLGDIKISLFLILHIGMSQPAAL